MCDYLPRAAEALDDLMKDLIAASPAPPYLDKFDKDPDSFL